MLIAFSNKQDSRAREHRNATTTATTKIQSTICKEIVLSLFLNVKQSQESNQKLLPKQPPKSSPLHPKIQCWVWFVLQLTCKEIERYTNSQGKRKLYPRSQNNSKADTVETYCLRITITAEPDSRQKSTLAAKLKSSPLHPKTQCWVGFKDTQKSMLQW